MPQLDPTWFSSQIFWLALTFVGLYILMSRVVLPPLQEVMVKRDSTIESNLTSAQQMKADAEAAQTDYERTLLEARNKAQGFIQDVLNEHKTKAEAENKVLDGQIEAKLDEASQRINQQKAKLLAELAPTSAELAGLIVEKLTKHEPQSDQVQATVNDLSKRKVS